MAYSKFRNKKVTNRDGARFDSMKEMARWAELRLLERDNRITELCRQVPFPIVINDQKICKYIADFTYIQDGKLILEDVKSKYTAKLPMYRLKKKLMLAVLGLEITEV